MLGRYLDSLNEVERDRVITGQGWTAGGALIAENRCLLGHVEVWTSEVFWSDHEAHRRRTEWEDRFEEAFSSCNPFFASIGVRFDALAANVGLDRAVQLVKVRAAKPNRVPMAPELATLEAAR